MAKKQRKYDMEYKIQAVKLANRLICNSRFFDQSFLCKFFRLTIFGNKSSNYLLVHSVTSFHKVL